MLSLLLVAAALTAAANEFYMYPAAYEHGDGLGAAVNDLALKDLIRERTYEESGVRSEPTVGHRIDLNNDGQAEVFLVPADADLELGRIWFDIFSEQEGSYAYIGSTPGRGFRLGESKNGYARLLVDDNLGNRTSWIHVVHVLAFNGEKYALEYESSMSHGQMEEYGLKAYQEKDYATAEEWFTSILRTGARHPLHDKNNLAAVYLKTGRHQATLELLVPARKTITRTWKVSDLANTEYNLGKAYEGLENFPAAWKHYYEAFKLKPNEARRETLIRLKDQGVDTSGFTEIWETKKSK